MIKFIKKISIYILTKINFKCIKDKTFIKIKYYFVMDKKLNLENPKTFNEKLQWLKLYDRNPEYTKMVDKYEAKKYVLNLIGEEHIIPTLGIYNNFEEINLAKLPDKFVIKPTHTSGNVYICKDKNIINLEKLRKLINKWLKRKYYYLHREWPYKNIKPRIIIEKYMSTEKQPELIDYKFFCFNGEPKILLVCSGRSKKLKKTWFDVKWNKLDLEEGNCETDGTLKKPKNLDLMIELARKLSRKIPFVRIDFYENDSRVYFSEITFYPNSGFEKFKPEKYDKILGDMIELPKEKREEK